MHLCVVWLVGCRVSDPVPRTISEVEEATHADNDNRITSPGFRVPPPSRRSPLCSIRYKFGFFAFIKRSARQNTTSEQGAVSTQRGSTTRQRECKGNMQCSVCLCFRGVHECRTGR